MSKKRRKRKRARVAEPGGQVQAGSEDQGKGYREAVAVTAAELDRRFGRAWRDDPAVVAEFGRVIMEECEARGIMVVEDGKRLHEKVFGPDLSAPEQ